MKYGRCSLIKSAKSVLDKLDIENTVNARVEYKRRVEQTFMGF